MREHHCWAVVMEGRTAMTLRPGLISVGTLFKFFLENVPIWKSGIYHWGLRPPASRCSSSVCLNPFVRTVATQEYLIVPVVVLEELHMERSELGGPLWILQTHLTAQTSRSPEYTQETISKSSQERFTCISKKVVRQDSSNHHHHLVLRCLKDGWKSTLVKPGITGIFI